MYDILLFAIAVATTAAVIMLFDLDPIRSLSKGCYADVVKGVAAGAIPFVDMDDTTAARFVSWVTLVASTPVGAFAGVLIVATLAWLIVIVAFNFMRTLIRWAAGHLIQRASVKT